MLVTKEPEALRNESANGAFPVQKHECRIHSKAQNAFTKEPERRRVPRMAVIAKRSGTRKRHEDILATMKAPTALSLRPLGQAAKTAPSHGAIVGSIPAGVTKRKRHPQCGCLCIPGLVRIAACPLPLRRPRSFHAPLAQLVEQLTLNQRAQGSSPWRCTRRTPAGRQFLYSSLAQSVEHAAVNRRVVGSSPTGGARMWLAATVAVTASLLFKRCGTVWAFSSVG